MIGTFFSPESLTVAPLRTSFQSGEYFWWIPSQWALSPGHSRPIRGQDSGHQPIRGRGRGSCLQIWGLLCRCTGPRWEVWCLTLESKKPAASQILKLDQVLQLQKHLSVYSRRINRWTFIKSNSNLYCDSDFSFTTKRILMGGITLLLAYKGELLVINCSVKVWSSDAWRC